MTGRALLTVSLFLCLSLPAAGEPAATPGHPHIAADFGLLQACQQPVPDAYSGHYRGAFAGNLSAHFKLTFTGTKVSGTLCYFDSEWPRPFNLDGSITSEGELALTVAKKGGTEIIGQMTGTFSGDDNDTFSGVWDNKMGNRTPCVFTRSAAYGIFTSSEGPLLTDSTGISQSAVIASVEYPRLLGRGYETLNTALAHRAQRDWNNIQTASSRAPADTGTRAYRDRRARRTFIYHADHRMAGMLTLEYSETGNPARSGHTWLTENYSFTDGQAKHVTLADLFRAGTPWVARLSSLSRDALLRQGASAVPPVFIAGDLQAFLVSPTGLSFWFSPGAVADESAGDFRVVVPWPEIAYLVDRDGPARYYLSNL